MNKKNLFTGALLLLMAVSLNAYSAVSGADFSDANYGKSSETAYNTAAEEYKVSAELPATHIPFAEEQQVVDIVVDDLKETMEAQEAGSFNKVFTSFTDAAFFTEEGEQLSVPNMKVLINKNATSTFIEVKIPAGTEIKKDVYYLGKRNSSNVIEDLRVQGYEIYITLSAGNDDPMPFVNIEPNKDEQQVINVDVEPYKTEIGEYFSSVFIDGENYFLVNENTEMDGMSPAPKEDVMQEGISLTYTEAEGLILTAEPNTNVTPGKYFIIWDEGESYTDWRWWGISNAYINLTADITECTAQDIVIESSYTEWSDIVQTGFAASIKEQLGEEQFNSIFSATRQIAYCFVDTETSELYPLLLIYPDTEFVVQVIESGVAIDNRNVYLALFDWNTEKAIEMPIKIYTNLTVKEKVEAIDGELPATTVESGEEEIVVNISTEDLKFSWDFVDTKYFKAVFTDGASYRLNDEGKADMGLSLVYSESEEALKLTVPANAVMEKTTCYLANAEGGDFRDLGYTISIELEIKQKSSVEKVEAENTVLATENGVTVNAESANVEIYNVSGVLVTESLVNGTKDFALTNGLYLVKVGEKTSKVVVR